jgi:hypothetical protein
MFATSTLDGTLYFTIIGEGKRGIGRSHPVNGRYTEPEYVMGSEGNPIPFGHPCVSPDGSFLILDGQNKEINRADLFVCFRQEDGTWGEALPFGNQLNNAHKNCVSLSPDGKYLFYTHFISNSETDIYWVSTDIIFRLKTN